MTQVAFSQAARQEIRRAFQWYEERHEGLGADFLRDVDAAAARLQANPQAFRLERSKYRRVHLKRFPYALHFMITRGGGVTILACLHFRQSPDRWPGA